MKERLDVLLVQRGLAPSREKAKVMIMEGNVFVESQREDKAGTFFDSQASIEVRGNTLKYVSRGGLKLEIAILGRLRGYLRTVCFKTGRKRFMRWMLAMGSLPGN